MLVIAHKYYLNVLLVLQFLIMKKPKLIAVSEKNYLRLVNYAKKNQLFDQVIDQILNEIVIK